MRAAHQKARLPRRRRVLAAAAVAAVAPLVVAYGASAAPFAQSIDPGVRAIDMTPRADVDPDDSPVPVDVPGLGDAGGAAGLVPDQVPTDVQPFEEPSQGTAPSGARIVGVQQVDPQTVDIMIDSPAMGTEVPIRLLLPRDYRAQPDRKFPALYLLPGYGDPADYRAWYEYTDVEQFLADKNVLVALPSGGDAGFFSNWWNYGAGGTPGWETFHTVELREALERDWRVNDRRAVAGLSMGGFGAMSYAARNPGLYDAAASYSGYLHTTLPGVDRVAQYTIAEQGLDPYALWGDPVLQAG
ncbi:MAG: esterase, partial [Actinobacteria bacterium]|nr:esterase [Actinomycetota bacterium]